MNPIERKTFDETAQYIFFIKEKNGPHSIRINIPPQYFYFVGEIQEYPKDPFEPIQKVWDEMESCPDWFYKHRSAFCEKMRMAIELCLKISRRKL